MKKTFIFTFIILLSLSFFSFKKTQAKEQNSNSVTLYFFHTSTCPHCKAEEKFLEEIKEDYSNLKIQSILVDKSQENQEIFKEVVEDHNLSGGVPTTLINGEAIVGFDDENGIGKKIKSKIEDCLKNSSESNTSSVVNQENTIQVFNKEICLDGEGSLCMLGGILGLADGVNPCMFSVLTFLLVYLIGIGSSKKALKAGLAFAITTFLFYLFFMYGLIKIISVLEIVNEVRVVIAILAFLIGLIMIKDFFFYGKGVSLEIPKKVKPALEKLTKKGTVLSAIILALLSSLVELPCTSGIPLAYVSILSTKDVFVFGYLLLYNFFFVLPLLVIVIGTIFVWKKVEKVEEWKERSKKYMRLIAGILLIFLATASWMNWF